MDTRMARQVHYTVEDYLQFEAGSPTKHEYFNGDMYAMAGGTPAHADLAAAVITLWRPQWIPRGCRVYTSDLRVRVLATGLWTYPDVTVVCGPPELAGPPLGVTNPTVLVEVTSDATEDYDRGSKLEHYQQIPSVRAVVFVSHRAPRLTAVLWRPDGWTTVEVDRHETLTVGGLFADITLAVDDVYAGVF